PGTSASRFRSMRRRVPSSPRTGWRSSPSRRPATRFRRSPARSHAPTADMPRPRAVPDPDPARHRVPAQRRQEMLQAVRGGSTHVAELARSFGVSEMTVRRGLATLAHAGKIERVHGGAINARGEPPFEETFVERLEAKNRIGAAAAALVPDGATV